MKLSREGNCSKYGERKRFPSQTPWNPTIFLKTYKITALYLQNIVPVEELAMSRVKEGEILSSPRLPSTFLCKHIGYMKRLDVYVYHCVFHIRNDCTVILRISIPAPITILKIRALTYLFTYMFLFVVKGRLTLTSAWRLMWLVVTGAKLLTLHLRSKQGGLSALSSSGRS